MQLTFIITIDPVKDLSLLNVLIHSLNLQTNKDFNVIFYNQTRVSEDEIFSQLRVPPAFDYRVYNLDRKYFLGRYPIWDLYAFHSFLIDHDLLNEYFMSLHMEEFFDVDYVEHVLEVLERNHFDILFGNLSRTQLKITEIKPLLNTETADQFQNYILMNGIRESHHWTFDYHPLLFRKNPCVLRDMVLRFIQFGFRKSLWPTSDGYTKVKRYIAEDLYMMKKEFAKRYNWYLRGHSMYFEDTHICEYKGVCELSKELKQITAFPIYFNRRKIYHIDHGKYYYQIVDDEFTTRMLHYETDDPILNTLKKAIRLYRTEALTLEKALAYSRRSPDCYGTQNLNYKYHMLYLKDQRQENA